MCCGRMLASQWLTAEAAILHVSLIRRSSHPQYHPQPHTNHHYTHKILSLVSSLHKKEPAYEAIKH